MKFRIFVPVLLIFISAGWAQNKLFTMEEAILGSDNGLHIQTIRQLQWIGDTHHWSYVDSLGQEFGLLKGGPDLPHPELILSLESLNNMLFMQGVEAQEIFPRVNWLNELTFWFKLKSRYWTYNLEDNKLSLLNTLPEGAANADFHEKSGRLAYTMGANLYITTEEGATLTLTTDSQDGIKNGDAYVHRAEFGIHKGTFWSPAANYLAWYRLDQSMVSQYPLMHIGQRPAVQELIRYPMNGMASEQVRVGVYNLRSGSLTYLQTGQPLDQYLCSVTWSPDERYIYVVHLNRDQNHLRLLQYDPESGQPLRTLFEERDDQWVEPMQGPVFLNNNPDRFVWFSKRDGYNHLYLYSSSGKLIKQLTHGKQDMIELISFDRKSQSAIVHAASPDGMEQHGYRVNLHSGKMQVLTSEPGIHHLQPSADASLLIDHFNNISTANRITLLDGQGKLDSTLLEAADPLSDYALGKIELLKIPNTTGQELNARLIYPVGFDRQKKYPLIVYVYGGPHGQMIRNSWISGWRLWFQYMAQRGYIIFTLDNRGTDNRGLEFEQAIHRQLGSVEVQDQMTGVEYLKSLSFVDTSRIGVHGWSYGGFMTISLLTRRPGVFKVGVAGGPVIDWRYYEVMYGERYMDTPLSNPDGFETANLLNYVANLDSKLLIIHGTIDPVVVWQQSLLYLRKAIDLGKQPDYFVYPGDEHNMRGKDRVHLYQKITDYFNLHL